MALPTVRLSTPGLDDLALDPFAGWIVQSLDLGDPIAREQVQDAPDTDGTIDTTALSGGRVITLAVVLAPRDGDVEALETQLKTFMNPRLRPEMFVTRSSGVEKRAVLRRLSYSGPVEVEDETMVVAQWVAPSGILESAVEHSATIVPGAGGDDGIEFDGVEFDGVEFPLVAPSGVVEVMNAGDRDALPVVRAFGPFGSGSDEVAIGNLTTGQELVFEGLVVADGDYLEVDFRAKTILVNGLASQSRYQLLKFPESSWWSLAPGINRISFLPDSYSGNAQAHVIWRDAYS